MNSYDADLSPYKGVSGNVYRVVKQTFYDKTVRYVIQLQSCVVTDSWVLLTERSSLKLAMEAIDFLIGKTVVEEEVVWNDKH